MIRCQYCHSINVWPTTYNNGHKSSSCLYCRACGARDFNIAFTDRGDVINISPPTSTTTSTALSTKLYVRSCLICHAYKVYDTKIENGRIVSICDSCRCLDFQTSNFASLTTISPTIDRCSHCYSADITLYGSIRYCDDCGTAQEYLPMNTSINRDIIYEEYV